MVDLTSVRATVYGRVQGVFFRYFVARRASELGINGYVRNLPQGTVEVMAEGERKPLERLLGYLREGPPAAKVDKVAVEWGEYTGNYADFKIGY
jgi:acylphosphatase